MSTVILALDLGKFNTVLAWFEPDTRKVRAMEDTGGSTSPPALRGRGRSRNRALAVSTPGEGGVAVCRKDAPSQ